MPTFNLPIPPTTNNLFSNIPGKGRIRSKKYKAWLDVAGWKIRIQNVPMTKGPVNISLLMQRPTANSDIDNRVKGILDLLVTMNVIEDDKNIQSITAAWGPVEGCVCTVRGTSDEPVF